MDLKGFIGAIREQSRYRKGFVEVFIDSPGGFVSVLKSYLMAFDMAKELDVTVRTYVMGEAASAGSLLAAAGTPGHRYIYQYGHHYLHYGSSGSMPTNPEEAERAAEYSKNHFQWIHARYMEHGKFTKATLDKLLKDEYGRLNAEEALKYSLADHIVGKEKSEQGHR